MKGSREYWNKRSRIFDTKVVASYTNAYDETVSRTLKYINPDDTVLDFACGTGLVTIRIADAAAHIIAIDTSDEMLAIASKKVLEDKKNNIDLFQATIFDRRLKPESFEVITAFNVLCYIRENGAAVRRIRSLLKPGGYFISVTDCLAQGITREGIKKFIRSKTGIMPYYAFYKMNDLWKLIALNGFQIVENANLFEKPPNYFIVAQKN